MSLDSWAVDKELRKPAFNEDVCLDRTTEVEGGKQLVKLLGWEKYLTYREIYPGQKMAHFQQ